MRKYLFFLTAAILILPISAWTRQSSSQGQQSSDSAATKSETEAAAPDSKKTAADSQSASANNAPQDPLAEAARRAKEQKKDAPKPKKVFTNDDIPTSGGISTASATEDKASSSDASADKSTANDEKMWRDKFAALRHKLDQDQAALAVMQRELGGLNLQFYGDPMKAMQQGYTRSDINNKTAEIEAKKKDIEADQQAISDAEDALRKAGGEPGWAR